MIPQDFLETENNCTIKTYSEQEIVVLRIYFQKTGKIVDIFGETLNLDP